MSLADARRLKSAALAEAAPDWKERQRRGDEVAIRVFDAGELLVIAHVPDLTKRPRFLASIRARLPGVAVKFNP